MSRFPQLDRQSVRAVGAGVALGSAGLLALHPFHMFVHYAPPGLVGHYVFPLFAALLQFVWASTLAWGVAAAVRGRTRSLTPATASISVLAAPLPFVAETFRRPRTDVVPVPEHITEWTPPSGPVEVATETFEIVGFWRLGCVLFLVAGVAWARGQRRWLYGTGVALVCYGGAHGAATTSFLHGMVFRPLVAAPVGAVLFAAGVRLAAPRGDEPESENADGAVAVSA